MMTMVSLAALASACTISVGDIDGRFTQSCNDNCGVPLILSNGSEITMTIDIRKTSFDILTGQSEESVYEYGKMEAGKRWFIGCTHESVNEQCDRQVDYEVVECRKPAPEFTFLPFVKIKKPERDE